MKSSQIIMPKVWDFIVHSISVITTNFGWNQTTIHSQVFRTKLIRLIWGPEIKDPEITLIHFLDEKLSEFV